MSCDADKTFCHQFPVQGMTSHDVANIKITYSVFLTTSFLSYLFFSVRVGRRGRFFILIGFIFSVS